MTSFRLAASLVVLMTTSTALAQEVPTHGATRMKSPGMEVGGAILVVAGVATCIGGAFLTAWSVTSHGATDRGVEPPPYALLGAAIPVDLIAIGSIVGGIVMVAIGSRHVPTEKVSISPAGLRVSW